MKKLLALVLGFLALPALAAEVEVEWEWPTRNTDGSTLALADIREIVLTHGTCQPGYVGLSTTDGTVRFPPPATIGRFIREPLGEACLRAYIVTVSGKESSSLIVSFVVADPPPDTAPPEPPKIIRIVLVFPQDPPEPPPAAFAVVGRSTSSGVTTKNKVYDVRSYGPQWVGELSVGMPCDCSDARTEAWGAGTGQYCRVDGQINETRTTYLALGSPFRPGSWTRCDPAP